MIEKSENIAIEVKNLSKSFDPKKRSLGLKNRLFHFFGLTDHADIKVINNLNLKVKKGEFLGIIGKNGAGKSTLLKLMMGVIKADDGSEIITNGKIIRLALGIGFDPNLSARDNIFLNGSIIGLTFKQIRNKFDEIIDFAELHDFVETPIKFYSSGMKSRLSFSIALHAEADIFLIDEFFGAVGDAVFKEKSQKAFEENILKGKTIIFVSHSLQLIKKNSDKVLVLKRNKSKLFDNADDAISYYLEK